MSDNIAYLPGVQPATTTTHKTGKLPPPWFRFFPSQWLAATRGLTATESGVLIHMLALMHESGAALPVDYRTLARLINTKTRTLKAAIHALANRGLIVRSEAGFWSDIAQRETSFRDQVRTQRAPKVVPENRKAKQNQRQNRHIQKSHSGESRRDEHKAHPDSGNSTSSTSQNSAPPRSPGGSRRRYFEQVSESGETIDVTALGPCIVCEVNDVTILVRTVQDGTSYDAEYRPDGSFGRIKPASFASDDLDDDIPF